MRSDARRGSLGARLAATRRLLVVEDEHAIADFLRAYFRASGIDVVHVDPGSVAEVLAAVIDHRPDALLLDLNLRGFSGADVYRALRADSAMVLIPIIVVTGAPRLGRDLDVEPLDAVVGKPFSVSELAALVTDRIGEARAR